jgi:hypothetical protein
MVALPRRRGLELRRLAWLALIVAAAGLDALDASEPLIPLAVLTLSGLVSLRLAPHLALAVALVWMQDLAVEPAVNRVVYGYFDAPVWASLAALAAVVALAALLVRRRAGAIAQS